MNNNPPKLCHSPIAEHTAGRPVARLLMGLALAGSALALAACEKKPPEFLPAEARGRETAVHFDTQSDQPRFLKIKKKDAQTKEAVARRREMKQRVKEVSRRGAFFE